MPHKGPIPDTGSDKTPESFKAKTLMLMDGLEAATFKPERKEPESGTEKAMAFINTDFLSDLHKASEKMAEKVAAKQPLPGLSDAAMKFARNHPADASAVLEWASSLYSNETGPIRLKIDKFSIFLKSSQMRVSEDGSNIVIMTPSKSLTEVELDPGVEVTVMTGTPESSTYECLFMGKVAVDKFPFQIQLFLIK
jgi:hypothetical protein